MRLFLILLLLIGIAAGQPQINYSITYTGTGNVTSSLDNVYEVEARVTKVIDGDTFDADVLFGDYRIATGETIRVRLADIDCPETRGSKASLAGKKASEYSKAWLLGNVIWLDIDNKTGQDRYDRWVSVVYLAGQNFNARLVDAGHAEITDFTDNEFDPSGW